jgi:hypothetical protein
MEKIKIYKLAFTALLDKYARTNEKLEKEPNNTELKYKLEDIDEELDYLHYEIIKMMNVGGKKDE